MSRFVVPLTNTRRLPVTTRNVTSILITSLCWLGLFAKALGMIKNGPERQGLSARRAFVHFSHFVQREQDICIVTVLFICLQSISFLPVAYIHSTLVVNHAYATSLRIVRKRHKLVHALHASGWLQTSCRVILSHLAWCAHPLWIGTWRRTKSNQAKSGIQVFLPTTKMSEHLDARGPLTVWHEWNNLGSVRARIQVTIISLVVASQRLSTELSRCTVTVESSVEHTAAGF
ncbi:MAG: hypothetical protein SGPRY_000301 [Prymnesium sp.]